MAINTFSLHAQVSAAGIILTVTLHHDGQNVEFVKSWAAPVCPGVYSPGIPDNTEDVGAACYTDMTVAGDVRSRALGFLR